MERVANPLIGAFRGPRQKPQSKYALNFPSTRWTNFNPHDPKHLTDVDLWECCEFPKTLVEFRNWWDTLALPGQNGKSEHILIPVKIAIVGVSLDDDSRLAPSLGTILLSPGVPSSSSRLRRVDLELSAVRYGNATLPGYEGNLPYDNSEIFFPLIEYDVAEFNQSSFISSFPKWRTGTFDRAFSDLYLASEQFSALQLDEVKKLISDQAAKGTEVFEAFGLKFPAGQLTLWGTTVLLTVQLYLLVYLMQLSNRLAYDDPVWDFPWIDMNQSVMARVLYFVTTFLLPCFTIALLGGERVSMLTSNYWHRTVIVGTLGLIIAFFATLVLSILSWRYRPRRTQSLGSTHQYFE